MVYSCKEDYIGPYHSCNLLQTLRVLTPTSCTFTKCKYLGERYMEELPSFLAIKLSQGSIETKL